MSFKKPFEGVPIALGKHYRRRARKRSRRMTVAVLALATAAGATLGVASTLDPSSISSWIGQRHANGALVENVFGERVYWRRCADAEAAGAAPIYRGDPGYRSALDSDDDGVACEPYYAD